MANTESQAITASDLSFSSKESFGLFMEGLREMQLYGDEADQPQPRRPFLDCHLRDALCRLHQCVREFPNDPLPRYYLGVALTTRNQEEYVEALHDLSGALKSAGRYLALRDRNTELTKTRNGPDFSKLSNAQMQDILQRLDELAAQMKKAYQESQPFKNLEKASWHHLHESAMQFAELDKQLKEQLPSMSEASRYALRRATLYNLAEAYARLGRRGPNVDDLGMALQILNQMPKAFSMPRSFWSKGGNRDYRNLDLNRSIDPEILNECENNALDLQEQSLEFSLRARQALRTLADLENLGQASPTARAEAARRDKEIDELRKKVTDVGEELEDLETKIERANLPSRFRVDLQADYWTKVGFVTYEAAIVMTKANATAHEILAEAETALEKALELKPNWNPAQIYLALVSSIQAGVAEGTGDEAEKKRYEGKAKELFEALLGSSSEPAAPEGWQVEGTLAGGKPEMAIKVEGHLRPATNG